MTTSPKPRFRLIAGRPCSDKPRLRQMPAAAPSKLERAITYLRERGIYVLDRGTPRPRWGLAGDVPTNESPLLTKIMEADRRRKA